MTVPEHVLTSCWRKSRYSDTGQCVEVATTPAACAIRDSRYPGGNCLVTSPEAWTTFTRKIRAGNLPATAVSRLRPRHGGDQADALATSGSAPTFSVPPAPARSAQPVDSTAEM